MRFLALLAVASILALAGCTKAPEHVDTASVSTTDPTASGAPPSPSAPTPSSPTPQPSPAPSPTTTPTPPTPPPQPPASTPPDSYANKTGWATPNAPQDPTSTARLTFAVLFGAKNFTVRASDMTVTPEANKAGAPFSVTITDAQGKAVYSEPANAAGTGTPETPAGADPVENKIEKDATSLAPGEYTITMTITPGADGSASGQSLGDRYFLSAYVHY